MTCTIHPTLPETDTHKDYTRFHFDTSNVPDKRIVGLLACQREFRLRYCKRIKHLMSDNGQVTHSFVSFERKCMPLGKRN